MGKKIGFQEALHHLVVFWDLRIPVKNTISFLDIHSGLLLNSEFIGAAQCTGVCKVIKSECLIIKK